MWIYVLNCLIIMLGFLFIKIFAVPLAIQAFRCVLWGKKLQFVAKLQQYTEQTSGDPEKHTRKRFIEDIHDLRYTQAAGNCSSSSTYTYARIAQ